MHIMRTMMIGASLAMAAAVVPVGAANAAVTTTVSVSNTATLLARGAAVSVPVTVTCTTDLPPISYGYVQVSLTQRQGRSLVQGSNAVDLTSCDGTPQTYQVQITGDGPFKAGAAVASGYTYVCDSEYSCTSAQEGKAIQINR